MPTEMNDLGRRIQQRRKEMALTLRKLAAASGTSASHLGRIERAERFPSARIIGRIAGPLGFEEIELLSLAGFLSPTQPDTAREESGRTRSGLDPYVAGALASEPFAVQRIAIGILSILKTLGKSTTEDGQHR